MYTLDMLYYVRMQFALIEEFTCACTYQIYWCIQAHLSSPNITIKSSTYM